MLGQRDALIAQLAKSLNLVSEAGLKRATDLKRRFPNRTLDQLLLDAGLITKENHARLLKAAGKTLPPQKPEATADTGSDDGLIVPDEEDQKALGRRAAPEPLALPPSDEGKSSGLGASDEEAILAEPTIKLSDSSGTRRALPAPVDEEAILAEPTLKLQADETRGRTRAPAPTPAVDEAAILAEPTLKLRPDEVRGRPAAPAPAKAPPKPVDEAAILAEPTLMLRDDELKATPGKPKVPVALPPRAPAPTAPPRKPAPALNEDQILAEPTLVLGAAELKKKKEPELLPATDDSDLAVPDDEAPVLSDEQEQAILSEPTVMLGDDELRRAPRPAKKEAAPAPASTVGAPLDLLPDSEEKKVPPPGPELAIPAQITAGESSDTESGSKGPQPGIKKKGKGGLLDRKEFERRSKLRMGFEGLHVGDYEIVGELSRGAFGVVLKVRPESTAKTLARERGFTGEFMAMKVMLETNDPEETRRFMDEVKVLIDLIHPNIVRIFDAGVEKGLKFYTMELIEGVDSRTLVREQGGKLPVLYAVRIAKDVAGALAAVHAKTIYHRDLKPANVMVDKASNPYRTVLIDFGLVVKRHGDKKDDGLILGTPSYMPPEQAKPKGGFGEVNGTSDIYSLGATFYFLMTGQAPFPGKDPREIIKRVCTEPPPSPVSLNAEIPKSIAALCLKCLSKNQRDRYVAARILEQELESELSSAQLKLKAKGFVRRIFGGGGGPNK